MSLIQFTILLIYIVLLVQNYKAYRKDTISNVLVVGTSLMLIFLLCSNNYADIDWSETELDISGYRMMYEKYDVLEHPDFKMYYIYYGSMYLGQKFGVPFNVWWAIMSTIAISVTYIACKIHKFSYNLFLASFMAFYVFAMYSGLKFCYGFCFLLLAFGFILWNTRKGKFIFATITCIAGGFHMMYYFYLILLIKPSKRPEFFVKTIISITVVFTILMRISGSATAFLGPFFNALDNDHINGYTAVNVNLGFYIPIIIHVTMVYLTYKARLYCIRKGTLTSAMDTLYYTSILSLIFCPFYAVALTFMRLITAFSLVVITSMSAILKDSVESRSLCQRMSLIMVSTFLFMKFISGAMGFINSSVIPFFNVL